MVEIRHMIEADWPVVANIYQQGINTGNATFAPAPPPTWAAWCESKLDACSLVACSGAGVLGWAAASPVSSREVYAGVAEHSIYVAAAAAGRGIGAALLAALIDVSEAQGIWTLQSSIFPENMVSLRLHERHGFRQVGRRAQIGLMRYGPWQGQWRDTILVERRSAWVGSTYSPRSVS